MSAFPCTGFLSIGLLISVNAPVSDLLCLLTFLAAKVTFCFLFGLLIGLKSPCPRCLRALCGRTGIEYCAVPPGQEQNIVLSCKTDAGLLSAVIGGFEVEKEMSGTGEEMGASSCRSGRP